MQHRLLGGLSPRTFLRRHWQKRPLFVPGALDLPPLVDERALTALARRDDVESRIVQRRAGRWETRHGPFAAIKARKINWSILVHGVNLHVRAADELLRRFSFVPQARLDDVMVSYATAGGGVGPHVDSYDVFLIQGPGRRRWTVGRKVFLARPGDLLYLPPGLEHDGVALEPCFTYSVGFRAPGGAELGAAFLDWLHERGFPDARYRDPGLRPAAHPGRLPPELLRFAGALLAAIRWTRGDIADFLGRYLTQPKPHVVFRPRPARGARLRLDPGSQLLYSGRDFFLNGDALAVPLRARPAMRELADRREIDAARLAAMAELVGEWRRVGYAHLEKHDG
jgi:50S ribosomal protein L16 3-hydroxylase